MKVQVGILKYFKVEYFSLKYEPEAGRLFLKLRRKNDGRGQLWWRRSSKGASTASETKVHYLKSLNYLGSYLTT